jgi:hypothetical protein
MSEQQPPLTGELQKAARRTASNAGSPKSVQRLAQLGFDPIKELVDKYRAIEAEIEIQEGIRDGSIVQLKADDKPRAYSAEVHTMWMDKLLRVSTDLLRYNYGRVPEIVNDTPPVAPSFVVNMAMPTGEIKQVAGIVEPE